MDDRCSQNKLITLLIHLFQSTLVNMQNSIVPSSGGIQKTTLKYSHIILYQWVFISTLTYYRESLYNDTEYIETVIIKSGSSTKYQMRFY